MTEITIDRDPCCFDKQAILNIGQMQDSHIPDQDTNGTQVLVQRSTDPDMLQTVKVAREPWFCFVLAAQQTIQIDMMHDTPSRDSL